MTDFSGNFFYFNINTKTRNKDILCKYDCIIQPTIRCKDKEFYTCSKPAMERKQL